MRIGVIGSGQVGQTLSQGLKAHGYKTRIASRSPEKLAAFSKSSGIPTGTFAEVSAWAEAVVLAVKGDGAEAALREAGAANLNGKLVVDTTNPIAHEPPGGRRAEVLHLSERLADGASAGGVSRQKFVKAFNSVGSSLMVNPAFPGGAKPTVFYCGNDASAKAIVARILEQFGWDGADMGTAKAARAIEPLCQLRCIPGFRDNAWANYAFAVLRR